MLEGPVASAAAHHSPAQQLDRFGSAAANSDLWLQSCALLGLCPAALCSVPENAYAAVLCSPATRPRKVMRIVALDDRCGCDLMAIVLTGGAIRLCTTQRCKMRVKEGKRRRLELLQWPACPANRQASDACFAQAMLSTDCASTLLSLQHFFAGHVVSDALAGAPQS